MGEKILEREEIEAGAHRAPPSYSTLRRPDDMAEHDDVGPSGRLIPEGGEEDPGEILRRLKDAKLVSDDIEHWGTGTKRDGKVYLNDDGEACKIDKRGVPYKVGSDGRRTVPSRRPKHLYSPEDGTRWMRKQRAKRTRRPKEKGQKMPRNPGREPQWARSWLRRYWTR